MAVPQDLAALLEAGAHFGHQAKRWNPRMAPYIYTVRDGVHVFDLTITAKQLNEACEFVRELGKTGKNIVFVGTKRQAKAIVREEATRVGALYITERWMGGTVTNWEELSKRVKHLNDTKAKREAGAFAKYTKLERVMIDKDINRLDRFIGGISSLTDIPDALFVVDVNKEKVAVKEANLRNIPIVALVDSNSDPSGVTHVIPANDDAVRSIKYVVSRIASAYGEGREEFAKKQPVVDKDAGKNSKIQASNPKQTQNTKPQNQNSK